MIETDAEQKRGQRAEGGIEAVVIFTYTTDANHYHVMCRIVGCIALGVLHGEPTQNIDSPWSHQ